MSFLKYFRSGSTLQADVVAVLAAVTEIIKEEDGEETDIEYFSALLTALDAAPPDQVTRLAATAFLLKLVVRKVSKEVLQKYFGRTLQVSACTHNFTTSHGVLIPL